MTIAHFGSKPKWAEKSATHKLESIRFFRCLFKLAEINLQNRGSNNGDWYVICFMEEMSSVSDPKIREVIQCWY